MKQQSLLLALAVMGAVGIGIAQAERITPMPAQAPVMQSTQQVVEPVPVVRVQPTAAVVPTSVAAPTNVVAPASAPKTLVAPAPVGADTPKYGHRFMSFDEAHLRHNGKLPEGEMAQVTITQGVVNQTVQGETGQRDYRGPRIMPAPANPPVHMRGQHMNNDQHGAQHMKHRDRMYDQGRMNHQQHMHTQGRANDSVSKDSKGDGIVGMPSPIHEFNTIEEAVRFLGFNPHIPKLLPADYTMESVTTINKDILQIMYVANDGKNKFYRLEHIGEDANRIVYRVSATEKGDISGDYNSYSVVRSTYVGNTKVTFKGGEHMVRLATWEQDGQNHSISFDRAVTRDVAKSIIQNVKAVEKHGSKK